MLRGWQVRALVRDPGRAGRRELGIELSAGDLVDADAVERAVAGCTHVFHIAALYREAKHGDRLYRDVNVGGTRHILEAAAKHGITRTIHCSTAGVHGDVAQLPADEKTPFNPGDIYQETKLEAELLAKEAFLGGLPGAIFRPVGSMDRVTCVFSSCSRRFTPAASSCSAVAKSTTT